MRLKIVKLSDLPGADRAWGDFTALIKRISLTQGVEFPENPEDAGKNVAAIHAAAKRARKVVRTYRTPEGGRVTVLRSKRSSPQGPSSKKKGKR